MFRKRRRTFSESLRVKTPFFSRIKEIEDPSARRGIAKTKQFDEFFDRVGAGWRMIAKRKARVRSNHVARLCWRTPYAKSTTLAPYVRITGLRIFGSRRGEFRSAMCTPLPVPRATSCDLSFRTRLYLAPVLSSFRWHWNSLLNCIIGFSRKRLILELQVGILEIKILDLVMA